MVLILLSIRLRASFLAELLIMTRLKLFTTIFVQDWFMLTLKEHIRQKELSTVTIRLCVRDMLKHSKSWQNVLV